MKKLYLLLFFLFNFVVHWTHEGINIEVGTSVYAFFGTESGDDDEDDFWGYCVFCGPNCSGDCGPVITPEPPELEPDPCDVPGADPCECFGNCGYDDPCNGAGADPCDCFGDCGNGGGDNDPPTEIDCAGVSDGNAYYDNCGECVGGTTNKAPCQQDCAGVWGGKAYLNECNECINRNLGKFNNTLQGALLNRYNEIIPLLEYNCLDGLLLSGLDEFSGITISFNPNQNDPASYNPCTEKISFRSIDDISVFSIRAELFHAYQNQFYNGKVTQIRNDVENNHIGGSNIEFEEKAIYLFLCELGEIGCSPENMVGTEDIVIWIRNFITNHENLNGEPITLNPFEISTWFSALEKFRSYYVNDNSVFYGKPIDYSMLPSALLNLISLSMCL